MRIGALAIVGLLVSGCVGAKGEAESTETTSFAPAPEPTVADEFGSITGVVTNEELEAVSGADVALLEAPANATKTDNAGRFTFNELASGAYSVVIQRLGYESASKKVSVVAGEVTNVTFSLTAIDVSEARIETFDFDGFFSCGASTPAVTAACRTTADENDRTSFRTNMTEGAVTVVDAMTWDSSAPLTARSFRDVLNIVTAGSGSGQATGPSPLIVRLDDVKSKKTSQLNHLIWISYTGTGDPTQLVVVVYQQKFHILTSISYGAELPDDYTGLPP